MSGPSNLIPVFTLKLNHKILPRLVTVGKYDGERPCLTAATNGNKVIIHNPHRQSVAGTSSSSRVIPSFESDISLLTIGQHITSLSAGSLDLSNPSDVLLVGTHTHVLAYDVERNIELFHNEVCYDALSS
jgi:Bardet-Biedl syndrome 2 protein